MKTAGKLCGMGLIFLVALSACGKKEASAPQSDGDAKEAVVETSAPPANIDYAALAAAAVANDGRSDTDRESDERRKPAQALQFFKVFPGATVFEIEAGGGWYTEMLAHFVGDDGTVIMQNPEGFLAFVGEQIEQRLADNRLSNVRQSLSNFDALDAADNSVDVATWVQGPHELFFMPSDGVSFGDPAKTYSEIYRILKPGGIFAVIDHSAPAGAPESSGNDLHRTDPAIVREMAELAGFRLDAESDFLGNPDDDLSLGVFDPVIRGATDQFALRFVKPE